MSKINVSITIALVVAALSVLALLLLPSAAVEAPSEPVAGTTNDSVAATSTTVAEHDDLIRVSQPLPESTISSPLTIEGVARGTWFFEATFPIVLTNWDGLIIAEGYATADGDWMTEDYVPFTATLTFTPDTSVSNRGSLILQKSNASGLSEHDDAFEYTVYFAE